MANHKNPSSSSPACTKLRAYDFYQEQTPTNEIHTCTHLAFWPRLHPTHHQKPRGGKGMMLLSPDDDRILLFLSLSAIMNAISRDWDAFSLGSQWVW